MIGLEKYFAILQGKEKAKFLLAKKSGLLNKKIKRAYEILKSCELCERRCRANRIKGEKGFCGITTKWPIFGAHMHYGEEPELVPSATLFEAACDLRCIYCQNAPESISPELGKIWSIEEVAEWIEKMYEQGAKNINFVGGEPTPFIPFILKALSKVKVNIPVVFNSNAYYSEKASELLKDIVDVYLLDFRYFNEKCAIKLSNAPRYPEAAKRNFLAAKDAELLIRVLVMPNHLECDAKPIIKWIAENLGKNVRLNILQQYWPAWQAYKFPEINRRLSYEEYREVLNYAKKLGMKNLV